MSPRYAVQASTLLKFAAKRGFKKFTVPLLKRLYLDLGVPGERRTPSTEGPLLHGLLRHVLGDSATPEVIESAIRSRHEVADEQVERSLKASGAFDDSVASLLEDMGEDDDVQAQYAALKEARAKEERW